jgi:hypothetical protein
LLTRLSDLGIVETVYVDGVTARQESLMYNYPDVYDVRF